MGNMVKTAFNYLLFMWHFALDLLWKIISPVVKPIWNLLKPITSPITRPISEAITAFRGWVNHIANDTHAKLSSKLSSIKRDDLTPEFIKRSMTDSVTWIWNRVKETSPFQIKPTATPVESTPRTKVNRLV